MQRLDWKPTTALEKAGTKIVRLLNKPKYQSFFVGGIVRDHFLKNTSDNLDIATDATPEEVEKVLNSSKIHFKAIGKKFGTILAIHNGLKIEITTFRREGRYSDARHPDQVEFIREYLDDAQRRDLTVNALYFNPVTRELFDPTNGVRDLKAKIIRFVGDPKKRIDEDSLRMIRAVRLATVLGFKLERNSFAAIKTRAKLIQNVSGERVKTELDKILLSKHRAEGVNLLSSTGLLKFILPELESLKNTSHNSKQYHLEGNLYVHTLRVIDFMSPDLDLIYAGLFHDIGKIEAARHVFHKGEWVNTFHGHQLASLKIFIGFAAKYRFPRQGKDLISWLIKHHDDRGNYPLMKEVKRLNYSLHPHFRKLVEVWSADSYANIRLNESRKPVPGKSKSVVLARKIIGRIENKKELISKFSTGKFIMGETKMKPGIQIGQLAEKIKIKIIQGEIKNESEAKKFLQKFAKKS